MPQRGGDLATTRAFSKGLPEPAVGATFCSAGSPDPAVFATGGLAPAHGDASETSGRPGVAVRGLAQRGGGLCHTGGAESQSPTSAQPVRRGLPTPPSSRPEVFGEGLPTPPSSRPEVCLAQGDASGDLRSPGVAGQRPSATRLPQQRLFGEDLPSPTSAPSCSARVSRPRRLRDRSLGAAPGDASGDLRSPGVAGQETLPQQGGDLATTALFGEGLRPRRLRELFGGVSRPRRLHRPKVSPAQGERRETSVARRGRSETLPQQGRDLAQHAARLRARRRATCSARVSRPRRFVTGGLPAHGDASGDLRSAGVAGPETLPQQGWGPCTRVARTSRSPASPRPVRRGSPRPRRFFDRRSAGAWRSIGRPPVGRRGRSGDLATTGRRATLGDRSARVSDPAGLRDLFGEGLPTPPSSRPGGLAPAHGEASGDLRSAGVAGRRPCHNKGETLPQHGGDLPQQGGPCHNKGRGLPSPASVRPVRRGSPDPAVFATVRRGSPDPAVFATGGLARGDASGDLRSPGVAGQETLPQQGARVSRPRRSATCSARVSRPRRLRDLFGAGLPTPPSSRPEVSNRAGDASGDSGRSEWQVRRPCHNKGGTLPQQAGSPDPAVSATCSARVSRPRRLHDLFGEGLPGPTIFADRRSRAHHGDASGDLRSPREWQVRRPRAQQGRVGETLPQQWQVGRPSHNKGETFPNNGGNLATTRGRPCHNNGGDLATTRSAIAPPAMPRIPTSRGHNLAARGAHGLV